MPPPSDGSGFPTPSPHGSFTPPPPPPPGYQNFVPPVAGYSPANPATQFGSIVGFGTRLGAWLLDGLLYGIAMAVAAIPGIFFIFVAFEDCSGRRGDTEFQCLDNELQVGKLLAGIGLVGLGMLAVGALYLWALATSGQTWGRKIVGIKVIDEHTGASPGWGKAIGRSAFAWFISAQIIYIGYLWMLWDDNKQTLHDKVAGTHVIEA